MPKPTAQQVEQGPVAWIENLGGAVSYSPYHYYAQKLPEGVRFDLFTRPQQPLSEDAIFDIWKDKYSSWLGAEQFLHIFQHVEAIHHIEEKQ